MDTYYKTYEVIWADMDPNRHMRHSVYNDYAAQTRVSIFSNFGLPLDRIARQGLGPILFREETKFLREINLSEMIRVSCEVVKMKRDGSRWSFFHKITKEDDSKAAEITVDGAWLDLDTRKLGIPSDELQKLMLELPRSTDFEWMPEKIKE